MNKSKIIIALDYDSERDALSFADQIDPKRCRVKVGKQLFTRHGPSVVEALSSRGFNVFLDLKYHDIPNTVAQACRAAADLGVWMVNVHAQGGRRMMQAAREAVDSCDNKPLLIAVTILTSLAEEDIIETGLNGSPMDNVLRLARLAELSGMDGVVCSPMEIDSLRHQCSDSFQLVTPGIRPAGASSGDQRRVMTPSEAINKGASYLVIGRPVTQAEDPMKALETIEAQL